MKLNASQLYMIMSFMQSLANSTMFTTYAIFYIATLGLNPLELLIVGMVLELTVLIFEGITGVVADTYSRRLSVIAGIFLLASGFVLQGVIPSLDGLIPLVTVFAWVLISQLICGIGYTMISGAETAWVVDEVGADRMGNLFLRAKRYDLVGTLLGIGLSVGLSTLGTHLPYLIGGFFYLALGVFLICFMKEQRFVRPEREEGSSHWNEMKTTWLHGAKVIRHQPMLLMILLVTLFSGAASEGYDRLREAFLILEVGIPESSLSMAMWFGLIAAISTFLSIFVVWLTERRLDVSNERVVMVGMFVLTGLRILALLAFAFSPTFTWALVSLLLIGMLGVLIQPLFETWLNLNIESKVRATILSMMGQTDALGQTAGGPFVGWIGNRFSIRASLVVAAILLSPILLVFGRALRKR
jgi:MFS family permease